MYDVFMAVLNFIKTTPISFQFHETTYEFTFWELALSIMVVELGIYVIRRIING